MTRRTRTWPAFLPLVALLVAGGCARTVAGEAVAAAPTAVTTGAAPSTTAPPTSTPSGPAGCDVSVMDDGDRSSYRVTSRGGPARTRSTDDGLFVACGGGPEVRVRFDPGSAVVLDLDDAQVLAGAGESTTIGPYRVEVATVDATSAMFSLTLSG